jgi:hypothetical protein
LTLLFRKKRGHFKQIEGQGNPNIDEAFRLILKSVEV